MYLFERGLRQDLYQFIQSQTFDASMEQALWVEQDTAVLMERDGASGSSSGEKRPALDDGG